MVVRVGMLGVSEGNGHPFSFSSIINGYSEQGLRAAGWPGIHDYVRCRHASEFGVGDLRVTHAWTQDARQTSALCLAANIARAVDEPGDMIGEVDAVIIARDDHESHRPLAAPFLEAGIPVLIDKPLTLDMDDLRYFATYLREGTLMSCSGMRFAKELDGMRSRQVDHGELRLVRGTIVNDWARYGVHLLDAIFPLLDARPVSVRALPTRHESLMITMSDGVPVIIDALGAAPKVFCIEMLGDNKISRVDINDNFSMFRRTLWEFWNMVCHGRSAVSPASTIDVIRTLVAGKQALHTNREVALSGLEVS